eukprot:COSAG06_NODE_71306_length_185_cov_99.546512_1_plen_41_part_01
MMAMIGFSFLFLANDRCCQTNEMHGIKQKRERKHIIVCLSV